MTTNEYFLGREAIERTGHVFETVVTPLYTIDFIDTDEGNVQVSCNPHSSTGSLSQRIQWLQPHSLISAKDFVSSMLEQGRVPYIGKKKVKWLPPGNEPKVKVVLAESALVKLEQVVVPPTVASPTSESSIRTNHDLLLSVIGDLFSRAETHTQRKACLAYLLHYQHYNADFTIHECDRLAYPHPVVAPQEFPGYFRTEYHRSYELAAPWIQKVVLKAFKKTFFKQGLSKDSFGFATSMTVPVLKAFFPSVQIDTLQSLCEDWNWDLEDDSPRVVLVEIDQSDLHNQAHEVVKRKLSAVCNELRLPKEIKLGRIKRNLSKLSFLFLLRGAGDCSLMWGAIWGSPHVDRLTLRPCSIENEQLFGPHTFSTLHEAGAFPDRLALNEYLTDQLKGEEEYPKALAELGIDYSGSITSDGLTDWNVLINELSDCTLEDPTSEFFRRAIVRWHERFFARHKLIEFAAPLLSSQVSPWMTKEDGAVQWTKAYQNLCEIVMFCLQAFPERFVDLDERRLLVSFQDRHIALSGIYSSVGLFPYAMTSAFHVFQHLFQRRGSLNIACISQHYHETLNLIKKMADEGQLISQQADRLKDINDMPDVLIADIHPNNAARDRLYQNDVAGWVQRQLKGNPSKEMVLILDATLNHLSDEDIEGTFLKLTPFITNGRLEVYIFQSLAKLFQLGADNFSGGLCYYLGLNEEQAPNFPAPISSKAAFYAMLATEFQDITTEYIRRVRKNTDWMYDYLLKELGSVSKEVWADETFQTKRGFSAVKITPSGDEETVYVALNFRPLLDMLGLPPLTEPLRELRVSKLRQVLLELAEICGLPITGRQSFGFSFSNMSGVVESIRFSIGIESEELIKRYGCLVRDFVYVLSRYTAETTKYPPEATKHTPRTIHFDVEEFSAGITTAFKILNGKASLLPVSLPIKEESYDADGGDILEAVGRATLLFVGGEVALNVIHDSERPSTESLVAESKIGAFIGNIRQDGVNWGPLDRLKLLFQVIYLGPDSVDVIAESFNSEPQYAIAGVIESKMLFKIHSEIQDDVSEIKVVTKPKFCLTLPDGQEYDPDHVYVRLDTFSSVPVKLRRLDLNTRRKVFFNCGCYHLKTEPWKEGVLLSFPTKKDCLNYRKHLKRLYREGGLSRVVEYINGVDPNAMKLVHDHSWPYAPDPFERLLSVLRSMGRFLVYRLNGRMMASLLSIKNKDCLGAVIRGMLDGLLKGAKDRKPLDMEVAGFIATTFARDDLPRFIDGHTLDRWLHEIDSETTTMPEDVSWFDAHLRALFPVISKCYGTPWSICRVEYTVSLRQIAERARSFPDLLNHLARLEREFPTSLEWVKGRRDLTQVLNFYVRYPLSDKNRTRLLDAVKELPKKLRCDWIELPGFFYDPIPQDHFGFGVVGDLRDVIFGNRESLRIGEFFVGSGCKELLLQKLAEGGEDLISDALRWAVVTRDEELFSKVLSVAKTQNIGEETVEKLKPYQSCLDSASSVQAELLALIEDFDSK